jgi:hypothetical protein
VLSLPDLLSLSKADAPTTIVPALTGEQPIVSTSEKRIGLIFWPPSSGTITIFPAYSVTLYQGIVLSAAGPPLQFWTMQHGGLVNREWRGRFDPTHLPTWPGMVDYWSVTATAANATATATKAAVSGRTHWLTGFTASSVPGANVQAIIQDGATTIWNVSTGGYGAFFIIMPLKGTAGNSMSGQIPATGVGNTGMVSISGFSTDPQTIAITEVFSP